MSYFFDIWSRDIIFYFTFMFSILFIFEQKETLLFIALGFIYIIRPTFTLSQQYCILSQLYFLSRKGRVVRALPADIAKPPEDRHTKDCTYTTSRTCLGHAMPRRLLWEIRSRQKIVICIRMADKASHTASEQLSLEVVEITATVRADGLNKPSWQSSNS